MNPGNTAVLFFTREAQDESRHKSLWGRGKNTQVLQELIQHTESEIRKTGLPYFIAREQHGGSFGEKFANAIQNVFDLGFEQVIALGNDSPGLTAQLILNAQRQFQNHDLVVGPSRDGGTYLLGLTKSGFDYKGFVQLPWQTNRLFMSLVLNSDRVAQLTITLGDIDKTEDLVQFLFNPGLHGKRIVHRLLNVWKKLSFNLARTVGNVLCYLSTNTGLRAPPLA